MFTLGQLRKLIKPLKLDQIASDWIRLDQIGSDWIRLDHSTLDTLAACQYYTRNDDFVLNIDYIKEFGSFGLCLSLLVFLAFLAFATLDESFKQKVAFWVKIKHNGPVCNYPMLKPISQ